MCLSVGGRGKEGLINVKHPAVGHENNGRKLIVVLTRLFSNHEVMIAADIGKFFFLYVYASIYINKHIKNGANIQPA